jgi:hypothetical protein
MIKGKQSKEMYSIIKPDVNYRELKSLNASMIKLFDSDPVKFYEEFKLGKKRKDRKTSTSIIIGDLVDFYILECRGNHEDFENRFDEKFCLNTGTKGTGQNAILAEILYEVTLDNTNEEGQVTAEFETMFKEAIVKIQAQGKFSGKDYDKILTEFNEKGYDYYQTLLDSTNKTVIPEVSLLDKAVSVAKAVLEDPFSKEMFEEDEHYEHFYKFPIEWVYETPNGRRIDCKSEIDLMIVDHGAKTIYLKDLKTTYDNEVFEYGYLKNQYYLQSSFYYLAVKYWMTQEGMADYTVDNMEFIVGDTSSNNRRPIIYRCTDTDVNFGLNGFHYRGAKHRGIHELISDIMWAEDNEIWNCSKEVYDKNGKISINISYDEPVYTEEIM